MKKKTTYEILRNKFPAGEYVLMEEVSDTSGYSRSRSLDFMLVNLWNSRGLAVTGFERKSWRGDWLKELKNPAKQEAHFKHCDYFYLLTDAENVAKIDEIPPTWGWYHINEKGILKTMKNAPKLDSHPIERSMMCAMLRRAAAKDNYVHVNTIEEEINKRVEESTKTKEYQLKDEAERGRILRQHVDQFEKAYGISITDRWDEQYAKKVGEAVKIIMSVGVSNVNESLKRTKGQLNSIVAKIDESIKQLGDAN